MRKILNFVLTKTASHNPAFKLFTAIFPGLGTVFLIFMKDPVYNATKLAAEYWHALLVYRENLQYHIDFLVLFYWIFIITWVFFYVIFVINESLNNKRNIQNNKDHLEIIKSEISGAIHNAPNPEVFSDYLIVLNNLLTHMKFVEQKFNDNKSEMDAYRLFFQQFLKNLCFLASKFSKNEIGLYSANIMEYYPNNNKNAVFIRSLKKKEKWPYFPMVDVDYVRGVLVGIPELVYVNGQPPPPIIAIPLVQTEDGKDLVLPGAGKAAKDGESMISMTDIAHGNQLHLFESSEHQNVIEFFEGPGCAIKSLASIAIPSVGAATGDNNDLSCLGIVNIDCAKVFLIGADERYLTTFSALIKPLLIIVAPILSDYFKMLAANIKHTSSI